MGSTILPYFRHRDEATINWYWYGGTTPAPINGAGRSMCDGIVVTGTIPVSTVLYTVRTATFGHTHFRTLCYISLISGLF
jgi:hypothetical protein